MNVTKGSVKLSGSSLANNTSGVLLASAARTTSTASANQTNYNAKGVIVTLKITAASGTGGLGVLISGLDSAGNAFQLNANPTAILATGTYAYEVYPGIGAASGAGDGWVNQRTLGSVPLSFKTIVSHADGSSYTYSVGYSLIL